MKYDKFFDSHIVNKLWILNFKEKWIIYNFKFYLVKKILIVISLEQGINLYSDYLYKADNIDVDYTLSVFMKINDYLSTTLIIQALYDDNTIKKVELREVFGLAFVIDIMKIPNIIWLPISQFSK